MNDTAVLLAPTVDGPPPLVWAAPIDGIYYDMPAEEYHAVEAMSSGGVKKMLRSPAHYRLMRTTRSAPTDAMEFGTVVHCGILEPDCFGSRVTIAPPINKRTKDGKIEWAAFQELNAGRILLNTEDGYAAHRCIDAVLSHPAASRLLEGARREVSLFWHDKRFRVPCKARLDAMSHGGIIDVKTCQDASPEGFSRAIGMYLYHAQAWHYFAGCEDVLDATPEFFAFICVETEPPHAVACYQLGRESMMAGARLVDEALARYRDALAAGKWEGYPPTINTINAPRWALRVDY